MARRGKRHSKPVSPNQEMLAKLTQRGLVAYASRNAQRLLPLYAVSCVGKKVFPLPPIGLLESSIYFTLEHAYQLADNSDYPEKHLLFYGDNIKKIIAFTSDEDLENSPIVATLSAIYVALDSIKGIGNGLGMSYIQEAASRIVTFVVKSSEINKFNKMALIDYDTLKNLPDSDLVERRLGPLWRFSKPWFCDLPMNYDLEEDSGVFERLAPAYQKEWNTYQKALCTFNSRFANFPLKINLSG